MNDEFHKNGFQIINNVFAENEIQEICTVLKQMEYDNSYGVREILLKNKKLVPLIFTDKLAEVISKVVLTKQQNLCNLRDLCENPMKNKSFVIRSLYFDKPPKANWSVIWHQDLTINLNKRLEIPDFINWRKTKDRVVVQPSLEILNKIYTIRIHLDDCTKDNGALHVVNKSHNQGVINIVDWMKSKKGEVNICEVKRGGIMLMKPLLLHSSKRTNNNASRRVLHIELLNAKTDNNLPWREKINFNKECCFF